MKWNKGNDINNLIQECGPFQTLIYVGDSKNDYCPALQLSKFDFSKLFKIKINQ